MKYIKSILIKIIGLNNIIRVYNFKDLVSNFVNDFNLYYKYSHIFKINNLNKIEAKIILNYHSVEKGFLFKNMKSRFAMQRIINLHELLIDQSVINNCNLSQIRVAYQVMCEYYEIHLKFDANINDYFTKKQYDFYKKILLQKNDLHFSSYIEYQYEDFYKFNQCNFDDFSNSRKSIRNFTGEVIDIELVKKAIKLASNAPSVCNRQSSKVYLVDDKNIIDKALEIQGGFAGYVKNVNQLLILTVDRNYFYNVGERNQFYIDGGIFLMNLLYSLHYYKIANCPANWGKLVKEEKLLENYIKIPEAEKIICMIQIGIAEDNFRVTLSKRRDVEEIFKPILN
jgi:nitroreductase